MKYDLYKCEECSRAIVTWSLSGTHLECSIPETSFKDYKCPQNLQYQPEQIIRNKLRDDFLSAEEMTI